MDLLCTHQYKNKWEYDLEFYMQHWYHMYPGMDQYTCFSGMLCQRDNLSLQHIQVYMLHKDLQSILKCIDMLLHGFFLNKLHWIHKGMDCRDPQDE